MRRKGELSPAQIDRQWPHQIAVPQLRCVGFSAAREYRRWATAAGRPRTAPAFGGQGQRMAQCVLFRDRGGRCGVPVPFMGEPFDPKDRAGATDEVEPDAMTLPLSQLNRKAFDLVAC